MLNTNKIQSDINTLCQKYSDYSLDHYTKDPDLILNTDPDTLLCDYGSLETDTDRQAFASFCGQLAQLGMKTGQFALAKSFAEKSFALEPRDDVQALLEKAQLYTDMTTEINEFYTKFRGNNLETPAEEAAYISAAAAILDRYESSVQDTAEKMALATFLSCLGSKFMVYTYNLHQGRLYYQKALALCPDSYKMHWGYYTSLEEIVEDEEQATPELIQDAIDCLTFCIGYCKTPALCRENYIQYRYFELARVYMAANNPAKAKECAEKSLAIEWNETVQKFIEKLEKQL